MSDDMTTGKRIAECRLALMQISGEEWSLQQATRANLDAANIEQIGRRHAVLELVRGTWQQRLFIQTQDARSRLDGKDNIACLKPDDFPMSRKMPFGTQLVANLMGIETEFQTAEEAGLALSGFVYGKCWLMALALHLKFSGREPGPLGPGGAA